MHGYELRDSLVTFSVLASPLDPKVTAEQRKWNETNFAQWNGGHKGNQFNRSVKAMPSISVATRPLMPQ